MDDLGYPHLWKPAVGHDSWLPFSPFSVSLSCSIPHPQTQKDVTLRTHNFSMKQEIYRAHLCPAAQPMNISDGKSKNGDANHWFGRAWNA